MGIHIIYGCAKHLMCTAYLLTYLVLGGNVGHCAKWTMKD